MRFPFVLFLCLILSLLAFPVHAASGGIPNAKENEYSSQEEKAGPVGLQWLGLGAGLVLGFGAGQAIEDRYLSAGWPFTVADGIGWFLIMRDFGDGPKGTNHHDFRAHKIGAVMIIASRIIQVGELIVYGAGHGQFTSRDSAESEAVSWGVVPTFAEPGLAGVIALRF